MLCSSPYSLRAREQAANRRQVGGPAVMGEDALARLRADAKLGVIIAE